VGRARRALRVLKALLYATIVAGIVFFAVDLYTTQSGWRVELAGPPRVTPLGAVVEIEAPLSIYNPSHSRVVAKLLWYSVYLGGEPVGQGLIPYLVLNPGPNRVSVDLKLDIVHMPCAAVENLANRGEIDISVKGYAMVTVMLFGRLGYRDIVVPFNTTAYRVKVPLPPASRAALRIAAAMCSAASSLPVRLP